MGSKSKLPPECNEKNAEDFLEYSQRIHDAIESMERNIDKIRESQITIATLSKKTNIHRNTLGGSNRGVWVKAELKRLKALKIERSASKLKVLTDDEKKIKEESAIKKLEKDLDLQRKETGRMFAKVEDLKKKLNESKSALNRLAQDNLALKDDNEKLLKRASANVTSITKKIRNK